MALHDEDERREVTYDEARAVLEAQRETLADMDTKAVRTVRITVLLVGALLSAWRIEAGLFDPVFASMGSLALVGSLVAGTFTYSESDIYLGPNEEYVTRLADGDFDDENWKENLLYNFGGWIAENGSEIRLNGYLLLTTQVLLVVGIVCTALAVAL
ncbi:hypothetical protein [Halorussus ruber]|uniref:hypothetical protein n=1 Tax=Halorussus ruber TaxID=1126238 RepID=UPI001092A60C|nr:hypothetical protein [Halorussus ruber]